MDLEKDTLHIIVIKLQGIRKENIRIFPSDSTTRKDSSIKLHASLPGIGCKSVV